MTQDKRIEMAALIAAHLAGRSMPLADMARDALALADAIIAAAGKSAETAETPKATRYDWSKAPEWAMYAATDADGKVVWFTEREWEDGAPGRGWCNFLEARP